MRFKLALKKSLNLALQLLHEDVKPIPREEVKSWFADNGDKTHRLNYPLNSESLVFDLGGYEGKWSSDIYCKYKCKIFIFEPSKTYYDKLVDRFSPNSDFKIFQFGLTDNEGQAKLYLQNDGSSIHVNKQDGKFEVIKLRSTREFLIQERITSIDLFKINIEGGEYDLLEELIESGWVNKIGDVQVQFHDFVENAEARMLKIQKELSKTHFLTYQYKFVWENWRLKDSK